MVDQNEPSAGTYRDDEAALVQALAALAADHPEVPVTELRDMLRRRFDRTSDAKVQQYRVVLAERDVRLELRRKASRSAV